MVGIDIDPGRHARDRGGRAVPARRRLRPRSLRGALDGAELVVHTAALVPGQRPMADSVRVNVGGTENVCVAARDSGVSGVVHLSSVAAWGYDFKTDITEDQPLATHSPHPYIATKAASELVARKHGATMVKPGDVYGPGSQPWAVIPFELIKSGPRRAADEGARDPHARLRGRPRGLHLPRADPARGRGRRLHRLGRAARHGEGVLRPLRADARQEGRPHSAGGGPAAAHAPDARAWTRTT